jgi:glycosyltransferase involved in cell wall biosynthesis
MRYDAVGGAAALQAEVRTLRPDVVILPSVFLHWAAHLAPMGVKVIADAADVLTDVTRRMAETAAGPLQRLSLLANSAACRTQERLFFPLCAEVWVSSAAEAARVREIAPGTPVVVVPNTVREPEQVTIARENFPVVGFLGTYSYLPNLDAARLLVEQVLPLLRENVHDVVVRLAGSGLPGELADRWGAQGVEPLGKVASSTRFLASCDVVALPVAVRGGVPLKLVEAMALGRPVVALSPLVDGLPLVARRDLEVAQDAVSFAARVAGLLSDPPRARAMGEAGRAAFREHFSRDALLRSARRSSMLAEAELSHGG